MLTATQPGYPYPGWSFPQFRLWTDRASRWRAAQKADAIACTNQAVGGAMGGDKAHAGMKQQIRELRAHA